MKEYIRVFYSDGETIITPTFAEYADYKLVNPDYENGICVGGIYAPWGVDNTVTYYGFVRHGHFKSEAIRVTLDYKINTTDQIERNNYRKSFGLLESI